MGGRLWLESEIGRGSTFFFTAGVASSTKVVTTRLPAAAAVQTSMVALKILVVDDNAVNRAVAAGILDKQGHDITVAANGREAVGIAERQRFDVILMDVQMPEMDGFAATARIRAAEAGSARYTPIIAMTARAAANDRERCLASGMDDYVAKPVSKEKLSLAIGRLCEIPARSPANTSPSHPPESDFCNERLLEQLDGDEDLLVRVMEIFRESTPELIERLREEQAAGDAAGLARTAHTLRGTLSNILAVRASLLAEEIEELARKESLDGLDGRILNLSCEFDTILAELGRFKPSHPATALV